MPKEMSNAELTLPKFLGLLISVVFIWIFFFSVWYSTNILNQDKFVSTVTTVLQSESVRDSVSQEIVDKVSQRRPILGAVTAPILTKVVSGILGTELFSRVYVGSARELHTQLTSKNPRSISIEIKPVKTFINRLTRDQDPKILENVPDSLVIARNQVPSLYKMGTALTLLGPILFIAALIILVYIWRRILDKRNYIVALSICFAISGFLVYCLIPAIGNHLAAQAASANIANIITRVYYAFANPISEMARDIFFLGVIAALLGRFLKKGMFKLPKS